MAEQPYIFARSDDGGSALISCSPVVKMCEKSHVGGGGGVSAPAGRPGGAAPRPAAAAPDTGGTPKLAARPAWPPTRPPERLRNPSTFVLNKSVQTIRVDVSPPCEW